MMQAGKIKSAFRAAVLAVLVPATACAGELEDKIAYCKCCHGAHGQGYLGAFTIPRLAGQKVPYMENVFKALEKHTRDNPPATMFMIPSERSIKPGMHSAIAKYFNGLEARPAEDGPRRLVAEGKKIYDEGVTSANVPACTTCHGADAKGSEAAPSLAGQHYSYLVGQLMGWNKGYRSKDSVTPGAPNDMQRVATGLTKEQIAAVAAYLSFAM